jgi:hypothetical protein
MVEGKEDKSSFCGKLIFAKKRLSWEALKSAFDLHEPPRAKGSLRFSWDNQRLGEEIRIMVRLHRVYIAKGLFQNQANRVAHYIIRGDKVRSYHHPISYAMELMKMPTRRSCWKMNTRHFKEVKEQIQQIWQSQLKVVCFTKMHKVIKFYKVFYKDKAIEFRREEVVFK